MFAVIEEASSVESPTFSPRERRKNKGPAAAAAITTMQASVAQGVNVALHDLRKYRNAIENSFALVPDIGAAGRSPWTASRHTTRVR